MKNSRHKPYIPPERHETVRQLIIAAVEGQERSGKDISGMVGVSEKEVYNHLHHIQKTLSKGELKLVVAPAQCRKCGFLFKKRDRLRKPGKCPVCRSESITEPRFSIR